MARRKAWSYLAGERGRNRVRVFEKRPGRFFAEWREDGRKKRAQLKGVRDAKAAKKKADSIAAEFGQLEENRQALITVARLMQLYLKEASPSKGISKQEHDRRAVRVWTAFFSAQDETSRQAERVASSLDRVDWDRFVQWRREGKIPGWPNPVGPRQAAYDLKFMIACLNWACGRKVDGEPILATSPWSAEVRRAQKWEMPRERTPHRPGMPDEVRQGLIAHAPGWQFRLALLLERETRRRNSAIRRLTWSDVNLDENTVRWRGEFDKSGRENVVPLTPKAVEALRKAPSRGIGDVPVFPSAADSSKPASRHSFQTWLRRAKKRWVRSVSENEREHLRAELRGVGFHSEKRSGVRDPRFRALPPAIQEAWAGTRYETLRTIYDDVTVDDIRAAMKAAGTEGQGMDTTNRHQDSSEQVEGVETGQVPG